MGFDSPNDDLFAPFYFSGVLGGESFPCIKKGKKKKSLVLLFTSSQCLPVARVSR